MCVRRGCVGGGGGGTSSWLVYEIRRGGGCF